MSTTTAPAILIPAPPQQRSRSYWAGRRPPPVARPRDDLAFGAHPASSCCSPSSFAPLLAPHDPYQTSMLRRLKPAGFPGYPLGTDELGRDMLTRLLYGGRLSWTIGITPVVLAFCHRRRCWG